MLDCWIFENFYIDVLCLIIFFKSLWINFLNWFLVDCLYLCLKNIIFFYNLLKLLLNILMLKDVSIFF